MDFKLKYVTYIFRFLFIYYIYFFQNIAPANK